MKAPIFHQAVTQKAINNIAVSEAYKNNINNNGIVYLYSEIFYKHKNTLLKHNLCMSTLTKNIENNCILPLNSRLC